MILRGLTDEDFLQYKKPSMFLIFPTCTFKCDIENGTHICQNWSLASQPQINIDQNRLIDRYLSNPITSAIVCGGLEPLDSFLELKSFIDCLRNKYNCQDDIVIYTGYKQEEVNLYINELKQYNNIIIKFGRFIPDHNHHYDDVLGVNLASSNQYAVKIS